MFSDRTNWKLASNRLTETLERVRSGGAKVLDLTVSNPTRIGLAFDQAAILHAFASPRALDYDPHPKGLLAARQAVAAYYCQEYRVDPDPEHIVLTTSTSEGYSYVFRLLCNPGDELLVPKPSYPLFEFLADLQDVKLIPYPLIYDHGWQMDFPSMERAFTKRTRGVVVVHPNNPTGSYVQPGEMGPLNVFCRERELALIVDEVFLDYAQVATPTPPHVGTAAAGHVGTAAPGCPVERSSTPTPAVEFERRSTCHPTFAANREVLTFTLSGLSKISALPQMKVSWIVISGPEDRVKASIPRMEIIADTYLSMNAPVQWALPMLLEQRKRVQPQLIARITDNLAALDKKLSAQRSCQRLALEGGWYAVLRVPVTQSDEDLAIALLERCHVFVHPGHFYDFPSDGYLVLSLIAQEEEFSEGVTRLMRHIGEYE